MKKIVVIVLLAVFALPTLAWGPRGHRIIAEVAYNHMTKRARQKVDAVLGTHGAVHWANWPDEIRSDTIYPDSYDWHFQDMNPGLSDSAVVAMLTDYAKEGGRLFEKTDSLIAVLRENPGNKDALVFIVHFMGDRFCPMHIAHMDDAGGNKVKMKWFGQNTNLHSVWDTKLIEYRGLSYTEYAAWLEDLYSREAKNIAAMSWPELTIRNYHLTCDIYTYQDTFDGNTYYYAYRWVANMEWQLYAAGIRLAKLLNELYR